MILVYREFEKLAACGGGVINDVAVPRYLREHRDGLTRNGILYWLVQRYKFGGVPFVGGPKLPEVDMDTLGIGRL